MPSMRSHPVSSQSTPHSAPARLVLSGTGDLAQLTYDALDESEALRYVRDAGAGATVLFVGTTRDTFQSECFCCVLHVVWTITELGQVDVRGRGRRVYV